MKKKLTKKDKTLLGVLIALIIIVIGVGAFLIVNNVNSANEDAKKILSSASGDNKSSENADNKSDKTSSSKTDKSSKTSVTDNAAVTDSTEGSNSQNNSSNSSASKTSGSDKKSSSTSSKTSSKKSSSKSSSSKVKGDKVKRVVPEEHTKHKSTSTLKINGKTCYVGDTISVVLNLTSQKSLINYQGTTKFDNQYLKLKTVKSNSIGLASAKDAEIMYNASTLNGMNFSETGTIYTATFEVLKSGSTNINNDLEIISELVDNNIVQLSPSDYKVTVDIYD